MKALILSDSFMGYGEACKNAFERMGFSTKLFMWSMFPSHTSFKDHIWLRLYGEDYIKHIIDSHIRQFDNEVLILAEEFSPDIVVVLFGTQISIDLAKTLFQKYTTVLTGYLNRTGKMTRFGHGTRSDAVP